MSLRTRLVLAFFLLSVVPLGAVTFYSYTNNVRALQNAAEREADLLAGELGQRMQLVTAQLSERESLAIVVGEDTPAERLFELVGLTRRLPIFRLRDAAHTALVEGQRARTQRTLKWLTDAELTTARSDAQAASDLATRRLDDITEEEHRRTPTQGPPTDEAPGSTE